jgi:hypothetical protein
MNTKLADWILFVLSLVACVGVTLMIALMLNLTGDCPPEVRNCGETPRLISFVVLGLGATLLFYLVRFVRRQRG